MKKNKLVKVVALFAVMLALALTASACGKNVTLVEFEDATDSCVLGSSYTLDLSDVSDTKGNTYAVTANVSDSKGKTVTVLDNKFDVLDMGGYTIVYSVNINEKDTRSRTVTLTVTDSGKPVISIADAPKLAELVEYTLPYYSVFDASGQEVQSSAALYYGDEETPLTGVENGKFMPAKAGKYTYVITASDPSGNTSESKFEFVIRPASLPEEIESFDIVGSESNISSVDGFSVRYGVELVDGVEHYAKLVNAESQWPSAKVKPRNPLASYSIYNKISFKVYVDGTTLPKGREYKLITIKIANTGTEDDNQHILLPVNQWVEVQISAAAFFAEVSESGFCTLFTGLNDGFPADAPALGREKDYNYAMYITDIKGLEYQSISESNNTEYTADLVDFNDPIIMHNIEFSSSAQYWTDDVMGVSKSIKVTTSNENWPQFKIISANESDSIKDDYTHISVKIYIDRNTVETPDERLRKKISDGVAHYSVPVGAWTEIVVPVDRLGDDGMLALNFLNDNALEGPEGQQQIGAERVHDSAFVYYLARVTAIKNKVAQKPNLIDFSSVGIMSDFVSEALAATYVSEEIDGVGGSIRMHYNTMESYPNAAFTSIKDLAWIKDQTEYTHVVYKVYLDGNSLSAANTEKQKKFQFSEHISAFIKADKWTEVRVPINLIGNRLFVGAMNDGHEGRIVEKDYVLYWGGMWLETRYEEELLNFNSNAVLNSIKDTVNPAEYVYEAFGMKNVVKINVSGQYNGFTLVSDIKDNSAKFSYYTHVSIKMYIDPATVAEGRMRKLMTEGVSRYRIPVGAWHEAIVPIDNITNHNFYFFNDNVVNDDPDRVTDETFTVYLAGYKAIKNKPAEKPDLIDFSSAGIMSEFEFAALGATYVSDDIAGVKGSIKLHFNTAEAYPNATFKSIKNPAPLKEQTEYTYVVYKVYLDGKSLSEANTQKQRKFQFCEHLSEIIRADEWVEIKVPIQTHIGDQGLFIGPMNVADHNIVEKDYVLYWGGLWLE